MFNLQFNPSAFVQVLPLLGKGLLGVFVVICVIWGFVVLLNKLTSKKEG